MTTNPLTAAEKTALRVMHTENTSPYLPAGVCGQCDRPWPCWYVRLQDELEQKEAELRLAAIYQCGDSWAHCNVCGSEWLVEDGEDRYHAADEAHEPGCRIGPAWVPAQAALHGPDAAAGADRWAMTPEPLRVIWSAQDVVFSLVVDARGRGMTDWEVFRACWAVCGEECRLSIVAQIGEPVAVVHNGERLRITGPMRIAEVVAWVQKQEHQDHNGTWSWT